MPCRTRSFVMGFAQESRTNLNPLVREASTQMSSGSTDACRRDVELIVFSIHGWGSQA